MSNMSNFILERNGECHFKPLHFGGFTLSIQASAYHYCSPRRTFNSSDEYNSFEVAIMRSNNDEDWFHPEQDEMMKDFSWAKYWSEYDNVAANVPREEVSKMVAFFQSNYRQF